MPRSGCFTPGLDEVATANPSFRLTPAIELGIATSIIALVGLTYWACITKHYLLLDDYWFAAYTGDYEPWQEFMRSARTVLAWCYQWLPNPPAPMEHYTWLRWVSVFAIGLHGYLVSRWLTVWRVRPIERVALGVLIGLLPAHQMFAAWTTCCLFPMASCLGVIAASLVDRCWSDRICHPRRAAVGMTIAIALLVISLATYQPAAMWYWPCWLVYVVPCADERPRQTVPWDKLGATFALGVVGVLAYYAATRIVLWSTHVNLVGRGELCDSPLEKLIWFWRKAVPQSFGLWIAYRHYIWLAVPCMAAVCAACWKMGRTADGLTSEPTRNRAWLSWAAMGALLALSYLPNLLVTENWRSFRSQTALTGLTLLLVAWSALVLGEPLWKARPRLRPALLGAITILVVGLVQQNVWKQLVEPQLIEFQYLRNQLTAATPGELSSIHLVAPHHSQTICPLISSDEFGQLSSSRCYAATGMVKLALLERDLPVENVRITAGFADAAIPLDATWVVDMRGMMPGLMKNAEIHRSRR